jgi:hypothetical protein
MIADFLDFFFETLKTKKSGKEIKGKKKTWTQIYIIF